MKPFSCHGLNCEKLHDLQCDLDRAYKEIQRLKAENIELQRDNKRLQMSNLEYVRKYNALKQGEDTGEGQAEK